MNAIARHERRTPVEQRHLRAVGDDDDAPRVSRHEPDSASAQGLDDMLIASGKGSAQAFEGVYAAMATPVFRLALRVVRDPGMAEDIAQEALVEAWRKAPEFDPARGSAKTWVLTIAHRRAVDRVRREQRQRKQMEAEAAVTEREAMPADQDTVVEVDFRRWQSERVRGALDTLTDIQRQAIELAYYGGCTQTEVAAQLGVPLGTTKTRIRDGMKRLRDALEEG